MQVKPPTRARKRTSIVRRVASGLKPKVVNPAETLFEFVKVLENIPTDPEKIAFNSKYTYAPDGSVIEY